MKPEKQKSESRKLISSKEISEKLFTYDKVQVKASYS